MIYFLKRTATYTLLYGIFLKQDYERFHLDELGSWVFFISAWQANLSEVWEDFHLTFRAPVWRLKHAFYHCCDLSMHSLIIPRFILCISIHFEFFKALTASFCRHFHVLPIKMSRFDSVPTSHPLWLTFGITMWKCSLRRIETAIKNSFFKFQDVCKAPFYFACTWRFAFLSIFAITSLSVYFIYPLAKHLQYTSC